MADKTDELAGVQKLVKSQAFWSLAKSIDALDPDHMTSANTGAHLRAIVAGMRGLQAALALDARATP